MATESLQTDVNVEAETEAAHMTGPSIPAASSGQQTMHNSTRHIGEHQSFREVAEGELRGERAEGGRFWQIRAPSRVMFIPDDLVERVSALGNPT
eukprot:3114362-Karenia_brevis.AAC.1